MLLSIEIRRGFRPPYVFWRVTCTAVAALVVGSGTGSTLRWLVGRAYPAHLATGAALVFGMVAAFTTLVVIGRRAPRLYRRDPHESRRER